ncbi:MAG: hypothetical protein H0W83_10105, partial [Planctomycetes bacterium]|nr:hypothetical protein [Planctomycetota bacterium]
LAHDDRPYAIQAAAAALANRHDRAAIPALEAAYARMSVSAPRVADACGAASDALRRGSSEHALAYLIAYRSAGQALTILTEVPLLPAGIAGEARWGISAPDAAAQESFALPVEDIPRAIQARNSRRLDRLHYLGCAIDVVDLVAR